MKYLVWSNEHRAWWGHGHCGYAYRIEGAGRYSLEEALAICNGANYSWNENNNPEELPIPEHVALQLKRAPAMDGTA